MKWRYSTLLLIIAFCVMFLNMPNIKAETLAEKGIFTVSEAVGNEIIKLDGDWEFYWGQLYAPRDFQNNSVQQEPIIVEVPYKWNHYSLNGEKLPKTGYATYRLRIKFQKDDVGTIKALYIPHMASAYNVWVDGEKKAFDGTVGTNKESMEPGRRSHIVPFQLESQIMELIIQVSNFNQRNAGIFKSILIGEPENILHYKDYKVIYRSVIIMSLLTMGIYHLLLFSFRRKEYSLIFFGVTCLLAAMRATLLETELAYFFFSFLDWEVVVKLIYNGATLSLLFFSLFTYLQYPEEMGLKMRNMIIVTMSLYSVFIITVPAIVSTNAEGILQVLSMAVFLCLLIVYIKAFIRKREGALVNILPIAILFLTAINDVFYFNKMVQSTDLTAVGLVFFLFAQSINISRRYAKSFGKTEKLSKNLALLNESLEQQVHDRTMELRNMNQELYMTNEKLQESQQARSKLIENISHEISTPLTSVMSYSKGMLDKVIPLDEKYVQVIHDKSSYIAQMLDDLRSLTNIENGKIFFHIEKANIREYMYMLYSKYKYDIESQGILFEYRDEVREKAELYVMIDKMRIEQVVVNLLSNASKFVKENGHILLKLSQSDNDYLVISVEDNGIGIKEEELKFVFERFYKSLNQVTQHQGTGLGLAISKEIIEYHNGKIDVESKEGEGSCFYFTLRISSSVTNQ